MKKIDRIDNLTQILIKSRESQNRSQRWMAKALSKSPTTISNWEEGISIPNLIDVLEWFDALEVNPITYLMNFIDSDLHVTEQFDDDEKNKSNLIEFINNVATPEMRRKFAFNLLGNTGSFFSAQLDLVTAHNLCTLDVRVNNAWVIFHHYIMAKQRGELLSYNITPDEKALYNAIRNGEQAAFNKKNGYTLKNPTEYL